MNNQWVNITTRKPKQDWRICFLYDFVIDLYCRRAVHVHVNRMLVKLSSYQHFSFTSLIWSTEEIFETSKTVWSMVISTWACLSHILSLCFQYFKWKNFDLISALKKNKHVLTYKHRIFNLLTYIFDMPVK